MHSYMQKYSYKSSFNESLVQFNPQSISYLSRAPPTRGFLSRECSQPITPGSNPYKNAIVTDSLRATIQENYQ